MIVRESFADGEEELPEIKEYPEIVSDNRNNS
jgi:hypothetical protein